MAKRSSLDDRIEAIGRVRRGGSLMAETIEVLRGGLKDSHAVVVERATIAAQELRARELIPELAEAFDRFIDDPGSDKSCITATALAEALQALSASEERRFLRGLKLKRIQMMPGPTDVAVGVRCACAAGLAAMGYRDALWEMAAFLHDDEPRCRATAAMALGMVGSAAGVPLLRYKIIVGDRDADVISECFKSLLALDLEHGVPLVSDHLDNPSESIAEAAALALGESRRPAALEALRAAFERGGSRQFRRVVLLSIGLLRLEAAVDFLISVVTSSDIRIAPDAIKALALYRRDDAIRSRVAEAVAARENPALSKAFDSEFA